MNVSGGSPTARAELTTSHFEILDNTLQPGEFVLLAGRLGLGSSWVAMHLALEHGLRRGQPVHYFSNQPGGGKWIDQLPWLAANLGWNRKYEGKLDASEQAALKDAARLLDSAPISCYRERFVPPELLHTHIPEEIPQDQPGALVVIDFLQWYGPDHLDHVERLTQTLFDLKQMAIRLNASAVLLCHLPRSVERREDKRPRLSDLPKAYVQNQVVDHVWLSYRHAYYYKDLSNHHVELCCHHLGAKEKVDARLINLRYF
jgi:replicative DNA helicase